MSRFGARLRGATPVASWFAGGSGRIKSIQRGTITIGPGATSATTSIQAVDVNNTRLVYLGVNAPGEDVANNTTCRVALTNATTMTGFVTSTGGGNRVLSFEVIEYFPGAIRSIQRDTATSATKAITTVDLSKTTLDPLGYTTTSNGPASGETVCNVRLSDASTLTVGGASGTFVVGYQVITWY